jgi:hypothetical protein
MNYKDAEKGLVAVASKHGTEAKQSPFKGKNFMTASVVTVRKLRNGLFAEISYGYFIDHFIYGVTLAPESEKTSAVQGCCHSFDEVEQKLTAAESI